MLLLAVARDGASRCGLLCSVLMFMCAVIGCGQGRRQSLWTAVFCFDVFMCTVIGCVQGRRQSLWTALFSVDVSVYCYWLCPGTAPVAVDCCVQC